MILHDNGANGNSSVVEGDAIGHFRKIVLGPVSFVKSSKPVNNILLGNLGIPTSSFAEDHTVS